MSRSPSQRERDRWLRRRGRNPDGASPAPNPCAPQPESAIGSLDPSHHDVCGVPGPVTRPGKPHAGIRVGLRVPDRGGQAVRLDVAISDGAEPHVMTLIGTRDNYVVLHTDTPEAAAALLERAALAIRRMAPRMRERAVLPVPTDEPVRLEIVALPAWFAPAAEHIPHADTGSDRTRTLEIESARPREENET